MKEKIINVKDIQPLERINRNYFFPGNNIFLLQGMVLTENEKNLLQKWKVHHLIERKHIKFDEHVFSNVYNYEKEDFEKLTKKLIRWIEHFNENIQKEYKVPFPSFSRALDNLYHGTETNLLYYIFYLHTNLLSKKLNNSMLLSSIYAFGIAKKMGYTFEKACDIFSMNIVCEIGFLKKSEMSMGMTLKGKKIKSSDFHYLKPHCVIGSKMASEILRYPKEIVADILTHHDYIDGSGFNQLSGTKISKRARIICLAQEFTYLTSDLLSDYSPTFDLANGMLELLKNSSRYDTEALTAFISFFSFYPPGTLLHLSNEKIGISLSNNPSSPSKPIVELIGRSSGSPLEETETLVLNDKSDTKIICVIRNNSLMRKLTKHHYN